ncbi:hypothetical protein F5883DRAFT_690100 [Diaporthe sp. PMI_573]|nr:hypothetical protein F5883DRAFT_690100 [Diaporthaceae sp. PMI_573]
MSHSVCGKRAIFTGDDHRPFTLIQAQALHTYLPSFFPSSRTCLSVAFSKVFVEKMDDPTHPTRREAHRIETQRLVIRTAAPGDASDIAALRGNPENNPYGGADSGDPDVYKGRISKWQKSNAEGRYAFLVILLRDSGRFIGFGGYNEFRWISPSGGQTEGKKDVLEVDIGAQIDHRYWRKGYAREAFQ